MIKQTFDPDFSFVVEPALDTLIGKFDIVKRSLQLKVVDDDVAAEKLLCYFGQPLLLERKVYKGTNVDVLKPSVEVAVCNVSLSEVKCNPVLVLVTILRHEALGVHGTAIIPTNKNELGGGDILAT
jgi:hypothetical protein